MIICFTFTYTHKNRILGDLLNIYAQKSGLAYRLCDDGEQITLFVQGTEQAVLHFSDHYLKFIPHSVFLQKTEVTVVEDFPDSSFKSTGAQYTNLTPSVIYAFVNEGKYQANEFGLFSTISLFKDNAFVTVKQDNIDELLAFALEALTHNKSLTLKQGDLTFVLKAGVVFDDARFLMPTSPHAIAEVFLSDEKSLEALASYEKPVVRQKINVIFANEHKEAPAFFDLKLPEDLFTYALCTQLFKAGVLFLSVQYEGELFKVCVGDEGLTVVHHGKFISQQDRDFLNSKADKQLALFWLIQDELHWHSKKVIRLFLSKHHNDKIALHDKESVVSTLKFSIPPSFEKLKEAIAQDETGAKLLANYEKEFAFAQGDIQGQDNFYTLFGICSRLLFDQDADYLLNKAAAAYSPKGVRLDFKMKDGQFDSVALVKSVMSFRLAGCEPVLLCYGFIDSLAYFLSHFLDNLKLEMDFDAVIGVGSLWEEKKLTDFVKKLLGKTYTLKFSNQYGLEV